jgi:hypothetical protein
LYALKKELPPNVIYRTSSLAFKERLSTIPEMGTLQERRS